MKGWLQSSDVSSKALNLELEDALELFTDHDWRAQHENQQNLAAEDKLNCAAGFGLVFGNNHMLHICPNEAGSIVHLHYPEKVWGVLWAVQRKTTKQDAPELEVKNMILKFYREEWADLKAYFSDVVA